MDLANNSNFVEKIKKERRIIASPRPTTGFDNKVTDVQLNLHNQWAKLAFNQSKYNFSYSPLKKSNFSNIPSLVNDLSPISDSTKKDDLDINRIKEIYNMKNENKIDYCPLSSAIPYDLSFSPKIPHDLLEPDHGWLSLSLGKCSLPKDYQSQEVNGFIQLYDGTEIVPVSEPVRFHIVKGEALFSQTIASSVYFPVSTKNPYIICFLNYLHKSCNCSVPFALDIIPLFNEKRQFLQPKKFSSQWANYAFNYNEIIKKKISNNDSYEKVDIEFNFNCTFSEKIEREFSYSWSLTPNTNYYVSPFPNISYHSTPTILLFNFDLTMKYPSNSKFVFLKLFVTEGIENIGSPKKLPLFSGIEMGKFSDCYITTANKTSQKEVEFIDQVSIYVDRVFPSTSCIVFHIFSIDYSKSEPSLLGCSAIPLFQDGSSLPYGCYKLKIFDLKKPPKELKKLIRKSNKKKKDFFQCQIRLPPPYFPPSTVKNVVDAVMPEQALPPNFKEISIEVYQRQIVPMTAKLLKIIAPNTALHLIRFLDIFESEKTNVVNTLRSWIFNAMNPELFGANFVNNLCKAFKSVITDELLNSNRNSTTSANANSSSNDPASSSNLRETRNLLLKQLGFALPLILDVILVSVSTPDVEYEQETVLDFLRLIPGIVYGLLKNHVQSVHSNSSSNQQASSRISHQHQHHSQRKAPIAEQGQDNEQQSAASRSSTSRSSALSVKENPEQNSSSSKRESKQQNSSMMAPIRLPPQALSPIIPELQTTSKLRPVSSASKEDERSSKLVINDNNSSDSLLLLQKDVPEEVDLNNHFANLISCLLPIFGYDKISPLVFKYICYLNTKKNSHSYSSYLSYLQFSFLMPFSYSEQFIVELALRCKTVESSDVSAYIPILSQIYLVLHKSLSGQNGADFVIKSEIDSINVACKFFSNICLSADKLPSEISEKVAFILFPLINTISSNYEGALVKQNSQVLLDLIPCVMFILNSSNCRLIQNYFSELGTSFQVHFMNFLEFIVRLWIEQLNSIRPVSIKVKRSGNQGELNLKIYCILTQHILNFLMRTIDIIGPCIDLVIKLLSSLYNSYQPVCNIKQFYVVCANLIQKYPVNRSIIAWLLSLLSFEQPDTKCFACSLLVLVFEADFKNSKTVIISSIDMMDSLTAVLLAVPVKYIPTYQALLNRIISLTKDSDSIEADQRKEFERMVNERMNASLIISNVVLEQKKSTSPPEIRCQRLMRIADQYKAFPTMRLKWLQEIVRVNNQYKLHAAAFTAQLHVCALIETVVNQLQSSNSVALKSIQTASSISLLPSISAPSRSVHSMVFDFFSHLKTTQPMRNAFSLSSVLNSEEDFAFMAGVLCETELDIESLGKDSQTLLSDFTVELLLSSLDKAIELGKLAALDYSLRPLYSLQLRIHQFKRNEPEKISNVLTKLSESISNIQTKSSIYYDLQLSFFLVECRKKCENGLIETKRQVFCVENSIVDQFTSFINSNGRFEDGTKVTYCNYHTPEKCNMPGVCVFRLQPVFSKSGNEFDHCFKKFTAIQNNGENNDLEVIEYRTKDYLPHYRLAADVVDEKRKKITQIQHIQKLTDSAIELLDQVASEFEVWYPMKPSSSKQVAAPSSPDFLPDEKFVLDDIKRISAVLRFVLTGNESIATVLAVFSQKVEEMKEAKLIGQVREMALSVYKAVARVLAVYRRAVNEFMTKQPNQQLLNLCEMMALEFSQQFRLDAIEVEQFVDDFDPMNDGIEYNE